MKLQSQSTHRRSRRQFIRQCVMFEAITETIRQPRLDGFVGESVVETNSTFSFNATAWNIGNAADYSIRARLVIQTSPPSQEVVGFLSTANGLSKGTGEWINLNLGATESIDLFAMLSFHQIVI